MSAIPNPSVCRKDPTANKVQNVNSPHYILLESGKSALLSYSRKNSAGKFTPFIARVDIVLYLEKCALMGGLLRLHRALVISRITCYAQKETLVS